MKPCAQVKFSLTHLDTHQHARPSVQKYRSQSCHAASAGAQHVCLLLELCILVCCAGPMMSVQDVQVTKQETRSIRGCLACKARRIRSLCRCMCARACARCRRREHSGRLCFSGLMVINVTMTIVCQVAAVQPFYSVSCLVFFLYQGWTLSLCGTMAVFASSFCPTSPCDNL